MEKETKPKTKKMEENNSQMIVSRGISPVMKPEEAKKLSAEYQALIKSVADKGDFTKIGPKMHPNKQFANKLARFFGLSVEIVKAEKENATKRTSLPNGQIKDEAYFVWHIVARATAPNGQYRDGDGHCATSERNFAHYHHDVYAQAVTRAKNRAILELVGMGEVSEEEIVSVKANDTGKSIEEIEIPIINQ
jgi:hypothetical protein